MISYKKLGFATYGAARKKASAMKNKYGYMPEVFKVTHPKTKRTRYIVVKPAGLERV